MTSSPSPPPTADEPIEMLAGPVHLVPCQADQGATFVLCDESGAILLRSLGNSAQDRAQAQRAADAINARGPLIEALRSILDGSQVSGRWLDPAGTECPQDDPSAQWTPYTAEEQDTWIASVADIARTAIQNAGERHRPEPSTGQQPTQAKLTATTSKPLETP